MVSDRCFMAKRSWRSEERCTVVLFGSVLVMAVYASDCRQDMDENEKCVKDATRVSCEGRCARIKKHCVAGGLKVELRLLSTCDDEVGELDGMCGPS